MHDIGVLSDWVTEGAAFGVKAFSALFVFALICAACYGALMVMTALLKGGDQREGQNDKRAH